MIYVMDATGGSLEHWPQQIGSISGQVAAADIHPDIGKLEVKSSVFGCVGVAW